MSNLIRSVKDLESYLQTQSLSFEVCGLEYLRNRQDPFPLRLPIHYAGLIDWKNPQDPLKKIALPSPEEDIIQPYEMADPIGDHAREAVPGLIHRYPDRALLLLTMHCRIHCRFCFRREVVAKVRPVDIAAIRQYLTEHTEIKEIIFSGGDPGTYPVAFLQNLVNQFGSIEHITTWRFHTRIPAVDPQSITPEWVEVLRSLGQTKQVVLATHIDHPRELSPETKDLLSQLHTAGVLLLSQTVLLKGVNDSEETLSELFRGLVEAKVKPYYLHHLDRATGTHHFRLSIEEGKRLFTQLRGNLSGICQPEYILDLPGGDGKVPVMWLSQTAPGHYQATTFEGRAVEYQDFAVPQN